MSIAIKFGGSAGQGVKTAGYIVTKALKDLGWWTFSYSEYPSLIRGGHSTFQINISNKKINSVTQFIDILVALNKETIEKHFEEIKEHGILLYDGNFKLPQSIIKHLNGKFIKQIKINTENILKKNNGNPIMSNSVLVGAVWALLTCKYKYIEDQVKRILSQKGKDEKTNINCCKDGYNFVKKYLNLYKNLTPQHPKSQRIIGTGNEVAGLAIYASGCRLFTAYPMTPSTGILQYLASRSKRTGMIVKQAEDEITAVQMAIGANFTGTRASCGTSGGGLALMTETLSLAGITETPLVVFNSQRPAPATGMPTWTEAGDLSFCLNAGHGDFPRILIAPGDIDEIFKLVPEAFNLSEKYQTLVIVLLDKYISESWYQTEKFSDSNIKVNRGKILSENDLLREIDYKRYKFTVSGISPRSLPGTKRGVFLANSDEHDEKGYSTEDLQTRKEMMDKRMRKLSGIKSEIPEPILYGPKNAKVTVICWGSQKGPILAAVDMINKTGPRVNVLHYSFVYPLKCETLNRLSRKNKLIAIENNYSSQFCKLIRQETGIEMNSKITKYAGTPFFCDEIYEILKRKL